MPDVDNPSGMFPIRPRTNIRDYPEFNSSSVKLCRKCGTTLDDDGIEHSMLCWWCHTGYEPGASGTNCPPTTELEVVTSKETEL